MASNMRAVEAFQASVAAFQVALETHNKAYRLEKGNGPEVDVFHMVASAIEFCDHHHLDFDLILEDVRTHFASAA